MDDAISIVWIMACLPLRLFVLMDITIESRFTLRFFRLSWVLLSDGFLEVENEKDETKQVSPFDAAAHGLGKQL